MSMQQPQQLELGEWLERIKRYVALFDTKPDWAFTDRITKDAKVPNTRQS